MLREALGRMGRRLAATVRRHGQRIDWSDYEAVFREAVGPALNAFRTLTGYGPSLDQFTTRHIHDCRTQLDSGNPEALAAEWETKLPDMAHDL